jgi:hypothetical protein
MEEIGTGVLDWDRKERISDRYGSVMLLDRPQSYQKPLGLCLSNEGKHGRLLAMVREIRESAHIGDLFHGVYPSKPDVGDIILLGEGTLFFSADRVGLLPDDNRSSLRLDIYGLYRVHNQTVTLFFDEGKAVHV